MNTREKDYPLTYNPEEKEIPKTTRAFNVTLDEDLLNKLALIGHLRKKRCGIAVIMREVLGKFVDRKLDGIEGLDAMLEQIGENSDVEETEENMAGVDLK